MIREFRRRAMLPRLWAPLALAGLLLGAAGAADVEQCELLRSDPPAYRTGGRTMVPFRLLFEWMGAEVNYADGVINAANDRTRLRMQIGATSAQVNGRAVRLEAAPAVRSGVTFVPLRFVSEQLGADVEWEATSNTATIKYRGKCAAIIAE